LTRGDRDQKPALDRRSPMTGVRDGVSAVQAGGCV
jgi:hypothetical protein